jgi:hypothetical protein
MPAFGLSQGMTTKNGAGNKRICTPEIRSRLRSLKPTGATLTQGLIRRLNGNAAPCYRHFGIKVDTTLKFVPRRSSATLST